MTGSMKATLFPLAILLFSTTVSCAGTKVFKISNSAMEPTVFQGESIIIAMGRFEPKRGELIVFEHDGVLQLKRVIGLEGDVVEGRDLQIFRNGELLKEPYIQHAGLPSNGKTLKTFSPVTVSKGELFVLGDNRDYSFDSRDRRFGKVTVQDVQGKPLRIARSSHSDRGGKSLE